MEPGRNQARPAVRVNTTSRVIVEHAVLRLAHLPLPGLRRLLRHTLLPRLLLHLQSRLMLRLRLLRHLQLPCVHLRVSNLRQLLCVHLLRLPLRLGLGLGLRLRL